MPGRARSTRSAIEGPRAELSARSRAALSVLPEHREHSKSQVKTVGLLSPKSQARQSVKQVAPLAPLRYSLHSSPHADDAVFDKLAFSAFEGTPGIVTIDSSGNFADV